MALVINCGKIRLVGDTILKVRQNKFMERKCEYTLVFVKQVRGDNFSARVFT